MRDRAKNKSKDAAADADAANALAPLQPPMSTVTLTGAGDDLMTQASDPVLGLRVYGTSIEHRFPTTPWDRLHVGKDPAAEIRIGDGSVSRQHARIVREGARLMVVDEGSKNGIYSGTYSEGARVALFELRPGAWISFGRVHMVAFSASTEATRARLQRFLGFGARFLQRVDDAAYAAARRRRHVVLQVPTAEAPTLARILHETSPGTAWPFIETTKPLDSEAAQATMLRHARTGTLVVQAQHWPDDPATLRAAFSVRVPDARLVLVARYEFKVEAALGVELRNAAVVVPVPTMEERGALEIEAAINLTAAEYGRPLGLSADPFTSRERAGFQRRTWGNPETLEFHIRRMVRVKLLGISKAAEVEGVEVSAMSRWASRNVDKAHLRA